MGATNLLAFRQVTKILYAFMFIFILGKFEQLIVFTKTMNQRKKQNILSHTFPRGKRNKPWIINFLLMITIIPCDNSFITKSGNVIVASVWHVISNQWRIKSVKGDRRADISFGKYCYILIVIWMIYTRPPRLLCFHR